MNKNDKQLDNKTRTTEKSKNKLDLNDGRFIPKYRFDEVSKKLKEQKDKCEELHLMLDSQAQHYIKILNNMKINCLIFEAVAKSNTKNFSTVLKFIKKENLTLTNAEKSIKYQLRKIKKDFPQLFYD